MQPSTTSMMTQAHHEWPLEPRSPTGSSSPCATRALAMAGARSVCHTHAKTAPTASAPHSHADTVHFTVSSRK